MLKSLLCVAGELILHSLCGRRTHKNHYPMLKSLLCVAWELILHSLCGRRTHKNHYPILSFIWKEQELIQKYFLFWHNSSMAETYKKKFCVLTSLFCLTGTHTAITLCWHHSSEWQELKKILFRCQSSVKQENFSFWYHSSVWKKNS